MYRLILNGIFSIEIEYSYDMYQFAHLIHLPQDGMPSPNIRYIHGWKEWCIFPQRSENVSNANDFCNRNKCLRTFHIVGRWLWLCHRSILTIWHLVYWRRNKRSKEFIRNVNSIQDVWIPQPLISMTTIAAALVATIQSPLSIINTFSFILALSLSRYDSCWPHHGYAWPYAIRRYNAEYMFALFQQIKEKRLAFEFIIILELFHPNYLLLWLSVKLHAQMWKWMNLSLSFCHYLMFT